MATQLKHNRERRDRRLVVLVSTKEKQQIEQRAREAELSVSDWLRLAGENFETPTEAELAALEQLAIELTDATARTEASSQMLLGSERRWAEFDETAHKDRIERLMERHWGDPEAVMKILRGELDDLETA